MIHDTLVFVGLGSICYAAWYVSPGLFWLTMGCIFVILGLGGYWGKAKG